MQDRPFEKKNIFLEVKGFSKSETLNIESDTLFEGFRELGASMASTVRQTLKEQTRGGKKALLKSANKYLTAFEKMAENDAITIKGVNYAKRYLETLRGYCKGAGITITEGVILQCELYAGCQTIFSQDVESKAIRLVHTEENAEDEDFESGKRYNYRLVRIHLPEKVVSFFAYPGFCAWGPAFGVNETENFVQAVDDLYIKGSYKNASIWANAFAFMFLDCGRVSEVPKLVSLIRSLVSKNGCIGGYAIHMAQGGETPEIVSVEYAGRVISQVKPYIFKDQKIVVQTNYPRDRRIKKYSQSNPPEKGKWSDRDIHLHLEMSKRHKRLLRLAKETSWSKGNAKKSIKKGLEVLANPYGDLAMYTDGNRKIRYYHTGLPSQWTVAHLVGYLDHHQGYFLMGKLIPKPIKGMEYSIEVDESYPYIEARLWELLEGERKKFYKKRKKRG